MLLGFSFFSRFFFFVFLSEKHSLKKRKTLDRKRNRGKKPRKKTKKRMAVTPEPCNPHSLGGKSEKWQCNRVTPRGGKWHYNRVIPRGGKWHWNRVIPRGGKDSTARGNTPQRAQSRAPHHKIAFVEPTPLSIKSWCRQEEKVKALTRMAWSVECQEGERGVPSRSHVHALVRTRTSFSFFRLKNKRFCDFQPLG